MNGYTVFLGDVALDEYYRTDHWPAVGGKTFIYQLKPQHGGMMANAACVYAALGGDARFMTPLNTGNISKLLVEGLRECGVSPDYVIWDDSLSDSKCLIFLVGDNNTIAVVNTGLSEICLSQEYFKALLGAEYVYSTLSDLLRLRYDNKSGLEVVASLRKAGVRFLCDMDTGYVDDCEEYYKHMDIAVFNHFGFDRYREERSVERAAADLLSCGISLVAVTKGEEGCRIFTPEETFSVPAYPASVADVTGAGDTFSASLLYALQRMDVRSAAQFASAAAAICVQGVGARAGAVPAERVFSMMQEGVSDGNR